MEDEPLVRMKKNGNEVVIANLDDLVNYFKQDLAAFEVGDKFEIVLTDRDGNVMPVGS